MKRSLLPLLLLAPVMVGCAPAADITTADACGVVTDTTTISFTDFAACADATYDSIAGFASTSASQGIRTTAYRNPADDAVLLNMSVGNLMAIGEQTWVQPRDDAWMVADVAAPDATVAGLSAAASQLSDLDITGIAAGTTGTLTATGTDTRLGRDVFVLTGDQTLQGITTSSTFYVTSDWGVLGSVQTATVNGSELTTLTDVTAWDERQDITPPQ